MNGAEIYGHYQHRKDRPIPILLSFMNIQSTQRIVAQCETIFQD